MPILVFTSKLVPARFTKLLRRDLNLLQLPLWQKVPPLTEVELCFERSEKLASGRCGLLVLEHSLSRRSGCVLSFSRNFRRGSEHAAVIRRHVSLSFHNLCAGEEYTAASDISAGV
jgi:hypothetical protein